MREVGRSDRNAYTGYALVFGAAALTFWVAFDDASYSLASRSTLAILFWWALIMGAGLGLIRLPARTRTLLPTLLLCLFAGWTLASLLWASSAEDSFNEFDRVSLYIGVFLVASLITGRVHRARLVDGLTLAIAAIALVALGSRLLTTGVQERKLATFLPAASSRLSFPLGYWNGLAIFVALGVPLLLRASIVARHRLVRASAVAALPVFGSVIYLASSRGGVATALVGAALFLALTPGRGTAVWALCTGTLGTAAAIAVLLGRTQLVNGPLSTTVAAHQGHTAAIIICLSSIAAGALFAAGAPAIAGRRLPPRVGKGLAIAGILLLVVGVVAAHPIRRAEQFSAPPQGTGGSDFARAHLISGNGSGRWQFWTAALHQWEKHPLQGDGAGSFASWWAQHASFSYFVTNAHSLYLETLGELGLVGLGLLAAFFIASLALGGRAVIAARGEDRVTASALLALVAAYAVAAGVDWMWELTAVTVVGLFSLGLLVASSDGVGDHLPSTRGNTSGRVLIVATGLAVVIAQAIPFLAQAQIGNSQAAAARGDLRAAQADALRARQIQPWAASPYLQLALTSELDGRPDDAESWVRKAIRRDPTDWRLWLVWVSCKTSSYTPTPSQDLTHRRSCWCAWRSF